MLFIIIIIIGFAFLCRVFLLLNNLLLRFYYFSLYSSAVSYVNIHFYCFYSLFFAPRWMRKLSPRGMESASYADSRLSRTRTRSITERVGMWSV